MKPDHEVLHLLYLLQETKAVSNHFFSLKNVSFCGYHPDNPRLDNTEQIFAEIKISSVRHIYICDSNIILWLKLKKMGNMQNIVEDSIDVKSRSISAFLPAFCRFLPFS